MSSRANDAPCKLACPIGIDVPRYNRLASGGRWQEALAVIRERTPFPAVLGHVCPAPCEARCQRGEIDQPVSIRAIKRLIYEKAGEVAEPPSAGPTGKKVAVIGSGPAGLTAAYYLAKLGHQVTVFEALSRPGGMLRVGIPEYRLPREVLDREIGRIEQAGVVIKTNSRIDSLAALRGDYDAVFVAVGAHRSLKMGVEGEASPGVIDCLKLLRDVSLGKKVKVGQKVAVIGGGNSAIDAARMALRLGAKEVSIIYRRSREEMPAQPSEVEEAIREGVQIQFLAAPLRISRPNGRVQMECQRMRLGEADESGRRRPEPVAHSRFRIESDVIISAIGQTAQAPRGIEISDGGLINAGETRVAGKGGIFAGGDAVSGPATVVEAISAGRQAAISIDKYLGGKGHIDMRMVPPEPEVVLPPAVKPGHILPSFGVAPYPEIPLSFSERAVMAERPVEERLVGVAEVELGLGEGAGMEEARRCLWCDMEPFVTEVNKCSICTCCQLRCSFVYTNAFNTEEGGVSIIEHSPGNKEITFNDNCVGCGVCARYCTFGALGLQKKARGE